MILISVREDNRRGLIVKNVSKTSFRGFMKCLPNDCFPVEKALSDRLF